MDVIANNLANVSAPGFKRESSKFEEYIAHVRPAEDQTGPQTVSFVKDAGVLRDSSQGNIERTGATYDLALTSKGYFQVQTPAGMRYTMLETIREYAAEQLDAMPEAEEVREAHAAVFLTLVEADGRPHAGLARKVWLERVDAEHNNIRAALSWYREHDPPAALRLAAAMSAFWSLRGHHTEGRQRLSDLLGLVPDASTARVSALNGAGWLAIDQGDYAVAAGLLGRPAGRRRAAALPAGPRRRHARV